MWPPRRCRSSARRSTPPARSRPARREPTESICACPFCSPECDVIRDLADRELSSNRTTRPKSAQIAATSRVGGPIVSDHGRSGGEKWGYERTVTTRTGDVRRGPNGHRPPVLDGYAVEKLPR